MLALILIIFLFGLIFWEPKITSKFQKSQPDVDNHQIKRLWQIAQASMRERKPLRAEKALLTILKFDQKNASAYNRLGILYAKNQKYDSAIECFEIAESLDPNPSSLHNAGLIYLETGAFEQAVIAFEQALKLEDNVPARYLALSKAEEKLGRKKAAISALESAYQLDPSVSTLRQILSLYESLDDQQGINEVTARIELKLAEIASSKAVKPKNSKSLKPRVPLRRRKI